MDLGDEFVYWIKELPRHILFATNTTQAKFMLNLESCRGNVEEMECAHLNSSRVAVKNRDKRWRCCNS
jgi:hypothetical protein